MPTTACRGEAQQVLSVRLTVCAMDDNRQNEEPRLSGQAPSISDSPNNSNRGRTYWEQANADINGMLGGVPAIGGFSSVSRIDLQGSRTFLARLGIGVKCGRKPVINAVDGGAGIGRVTEGLLLRIAEHVDIVEPVSKFTDHLKGTTGVRTIFNVGLEDWQPEKGIEYDLIWTQWCLGHLQDSQLIEYLKLCKTVLRPDSGVMVIKENLSTGSVDMFDDTDGSVTRRDETFRRLFEAAELKLVKTELQRGFPEIPPRRLLPVRMYALKP
ncbi:Protein N-terminal methyltransferase [Purpureocillium takamizusanense]|uniref:Alpha N-terminal protein methyltransferase 1 n=1 Tax=Purpureocillium takamizusanense TaxID=2060973 RepID=A0A9Q8QB23_9HYPO|nr:Protein N-terminal methyltransferase [Purpureocillium takamizusanense]UNI15676.1 Protein N-terminal methyltransferase [Purpureocillium takamizusanense]